MGLIDLITAIADAIRSKTGKSDKLTLAEMPTEIESIQTGVGNTDIEDGLITRTLTKYTNNRVTEIGSHAFYEMKKLESVDLPLVAKMSGANNFRGSTKLKSVNLPKLTNLASGAFYGCSALENINLPMLNSSIQGFNNCSSLKIADIGGGTSFGASAFSGCSVLDTLIIRKSSVITLGNINALTDTPIANGTGYIYVPKSLIDSYKVATNWITYAEQFRAIEDYPEICGGVTE